MVFDKATLGLGLQCGEQVEDFPVVSSSPPGMDKPSVGDVLESVNNIPLLDSNNDP